MDIMDSSDTPSGGLTTNTSSSSALPLSVDQRDAFASPTNRSTYGGQQPTSFSSGFSSGSSAMDRMDAVRSVNNDDYNAMPTSTDDVMMPHIEYASHPSMLTGTSSSLTSSTSSDLPTAQQVKDKAANAMDSAKVKASNAMESAKDKASDARDAAGDMTDSAKAKASDLADSAKVKASHLQDKMEDAADTVKEKLKEGMEKVKSTLHSAEHTVEDKYEHVKDDLAARRDAHHSSTANVTAPVVRSTISNEPTDTHPSVSSMRDPHLHPGLSSLPSHGNEIRAEKHDPSMSDAHRSALRAGDEAHARAVADAGVEPKDTSSREGTGLLFRMHDKLEEGVEAVKEKVDGFMERNVRTDDTHHLSAAKSEDFPTLIDNSNTHNTSMVRAKMHPSQERTISGATEEELDELA